MGVVSKSQEGMGGVGVGWCPGSSLPLAGHKGPLVSPSGSVLGHWLRQDTVRAIHKQREGTVQETGARLWLLELNEEADAECHPGKNKT